MIPAFGSISHDFPFVTMYSNRNNSVLPSKPKIRPFPERKGKDSFLRY